MWFANGKYWWQGQKPWWWQSLEDDGKMPIDARPGAAVSAPFQWTLGNTPFDVVEYLKASEWVPLDHLKPFYCWKQYHPYIPLSVRDKHCAIGRGTNLYPVSLRDTFWGKIIGKVGYCDEVRAVFKPVESCKVKLGRLGSIPLKVWILLLSENSIPLKPNTIKTL